MTVKHLHVDVQEHLNAWDVRVTWVHDTPNDQTCPGHLYQSLLLRYDRDDSAVQSVQHLALLNDLLNDMEKARSEDLALPDRGL